VTAAAELTLQPTALKPRCLAERARLAADALARAAEARLVYTPVTALAGASGDSRRGLQPGKRRARLRRAGVEGGAVYDPCRVLPAPAARVLRFIRALRDIPAAPACRTAHTPHPPQGAMGGQVT